MLRYETWRRQQQHQQSAVKGLQGARAALIPHQLYIAHQAANRAEPRIMLADEVGLGKTIEAGLIIQHRLINGLSQRVLILVPESLMYQWLVEMLRRFNLRFSLFDESRCMSFADEGNPFQHEQLILCSQQFFADFSGAARANARGRLGFGRGRRGSPFGMERGGAERGIFIRRTTGRRGTGFGVVDRHPGTIGQGKPFRSPALIGPGPFYDFKQFLVEEGQFEPVARLANLLIAGEMLDGEQQALLQRLLQHDNVDNWLREVNAAEGNAREELIKLLLDHHGTGRILYRNSRHTVQGFPDRQRHAYPFAGRGRR